VDDRSAKCGAPATSLEGTLSRCQGRLSRANLSAGHGPGIAFNSRLNRLGRTASLSAKATDVEDGTSSDKWKPRIIRVDTSMTRVNHGRPIDWRSTSSTLSPTLRRSPQLLAKTVSPTDAKSKVLVSATDTIPACREPSHLLLLCERFQRVSEMRAQAHPGRTLSMLCTSSGDKVASPKNGVRGNGLGSVASNVDGPSTVTSLATRCCMDSSRVTHGPSVPHHPGPAASAICNPSPSACENA